MSASKQLAVILFASFIASHPVSAQTVEIKFDKAVIGANPEGGLVAVDGVLYGTNTLRGAETASCSGGCGTIFKIVNNSAYPVYKFQGGSDGATPRGTLTLVDGILYGTTQLGGGSANCTNGCGTVFAVTKSGKEHVVYAFQGGTDGLGPLAGLINVGGRLYGTTVGGGGFGEGTVFSVTTTGLEKVVYSFCSQSACSDGYNPSTGLSPVRMTRG